MQFPLFGRNAGPLGSDVHSITSLTETRANRRERVSELEEVQSSMLEIN